MQQRQHKRLNIVFYIRLILLTNNITDNWAYDNTNLYKALSLIIKETLIEDGSRLLFYANFDSNSTKDRLYANDFLDGVLQGINNATYKVMLQQPKRFFNLRHNEIILLDNLTTFK